MGKEVYSCKCGRNGGTRKTHEDRQQGGRKGQKPAEKAGTGGTKGIKAHRNPHVTAPGAQAPRRPEMVEEHRPLLTTGSRVGNPLPNQWRITPCVT